MSKILKNKATIDYNDKTTTTCEVVTLVQGGLEIYKNAVTDATDANGNSILGKDETFQYQITLVNHADDAFTGIDVNPTNKAIVVVDNIPTGLKLVAGSLLYTVQTESTTTTNIPGLIANAAAYVNPNYSYTLAGNTLTVYIPSLPANSVGLISFNVEIDSSVTPAPVPGETVYSNSATVDYAENTGTEPEPSNGVDVKYSFAYIKATKTTSSELVQCGQTFSYTITLENEGDLPANNVTITDQLPADTDFEVDAAHIVVKLGAKTLVKDTDYSLDLSATNYLTITGIPAQGANPAVPLDIPGWGVLTVTVPGIVKC